MTKRANIYRQGDVWIYEIPRLQFRTQAASSTRTVSPDPKKGLILAEGEVTGHHHRIPQATRVQLRPERRGDGTVRFLEVLPEHGKTIADSAPVELVHEEHETLLLPPGQYEVRIQREYEPSARSKQSYVRD